MEPLKSFAKNPPKKDPLLRQKIRELPCFVCGRPGPSDVAHITTRRLLGDEPNNLLPMCRADHALSHSIGIKTFVERFRLPITFENGYPVLTFDWKI